MSAASCLCRSVFAFIFCLGMLTFVAVYEDIEGRQLCHLITISPTIIELNVLKSTSKSRHLRKSLFGT
jgi:hypothetical protein